MYCISVSHKTASVEERQKIAFTEREKTEFIVRFFDAKEITGMVIVSTCNRFELYFSGQITDYHYMEEQLLNFKNLREQGYERHLLVYDGERTIRHLHKVASGLDSMVVGEDEILGQLRDAYEMSLKEGKTDYEMNQIFQSAFACAKKIKTETALSKVPVSVASLTAKKIKETYPDGANVLILGITGKVGSIVCKDLIYKTGDKYRIMGTTRRHGEADKHVPQGISMGDYYKRYKYMEDADVVVSATNSPHYTVTGYDFKKLLDVDNKSPRKLLFMDLAVPNDIDQSIAQIENVTLYDIDYFNELAKANNEYKLSEAEKAQSYIEEYVDELLKVLAFHEFLPEFEKLGETEKGRYTQKQIYRWRDGLSYEEFKIMLKAVKLASDTVEE